MDGNLHPLLELSTMDGPIRMPILPPVKFPRRVCSSLTWYPPLHQYRRPPRSLSVVHRHPAQPRGRQRIHHCGYLTLISFCYLPFCPLLCSWHSNYVGHAFDRNPAHSIYLFMDILHFFNSADIYWKDTFDCFFRCFPSVLKKDFWHSDQGQESFDSVDTLLQTCSLRLYWMEMTIVQFE